MKNKIINSIAIFFGGFVFTIVIGIFSLVLMNLLASFGVNTNISFGLNKLNSINNMVSFGPEIIFGIYIIGAYLTYLYINKKY